MNNEEKNQSLPRADGKIKIAQIVGNATLGGVSMCVYNYFKLIDKSKFSFDFFTYGKSNLDDKIRELGGNVIYIPSFKKNPFATFVLAKKLKEGDYDIVHSHLSTLSGFVLFAARLAKVKARIVHSHSTTDDHEFTAFLKRLFRAGAIRQANAYFTCSHNSARWLYGRKKKAFLMPNAINLDTYKFDPEARERIRKGLGIDNFCIGFAGRMEYQKNLFFLLDVIKETGKLMPVTAVLVGNGSLKPRLQKIAARQGIDVRFMHGTDKINDYYSAFDCLCLPSKYEGLPLVGIEAQCNGLKVFYSDRITSEADFGNAVYLPDDKKEWARYINVDSSRKDCLPELEERGYDINIACKNLENEYVKIYDDFVKMAKLSKWVKEGFLK